MEERKKEERKLGIRQENKYKARDKVRKEEKQRR